jgi:hypothetical protein
MRHAGSPESVLQRMSAACGDMGVAHMYGSRHDTATRLNYPDAAVLETLVDQGGPRVRSFKLGHTVEGLWQRTNSFRSAQSN